MSKQKPLPLTFYNREKWYQTLLKHYSQTHKVLDEELLRFPIKVLTNAIGGVVDVYGNFPTDTCTILKQTMDPLYSAREYREKIYAVLKKEAITLEQPGFDPMADHLLRLRLTFERHPDFLKQYYSEEIGRFEPKDDGDSQEKFSHIIKNINVQHIKQVMGLIEKFIKENK